MSEKQTLNFQTESKQLLDLMIHSIYSNKEIFLRELISNASDALDKLQIEAIGNAELIKDHQSEIWLEVDKENRILTIKDNGIGMNREEVVNNIGTIARSGTRELIQKLKEDKAEGNQAELIGQFGVGFYSVFMVAEKVELLTRKAGEEAATYWVSEGDGEFSIEDSQKDSFGTEIRIKLKPADSENGLEDFTQDYVIDRVIKRYSDFIAYPIKTMREKTVEKKDAKEGDKKETIIEEKILNTMKPIWVRPESEVPDEEYNEFYKHISHDWTEPLKKIRFNVEGMMEFHSLLFIPSQPPFGFYYQDYKSGLQLYVKRVLIQEAFEDLLPRYLRFVQGVVESSDLPLNISREILQRDRHISIIKKKLTKKIIDVLAAMMKDDRETYLKFFSAFGNALKEGVTSDFENKDKLISLMLFESTEEAGKLYSLNDYIQRMKEDQEEIYYVTGESRDVLENSPQLERFKEKGYEVFLLTEPVDEIVAQTITEYEGKKFKNIAKGKVELGSEKEKKEAEEDLEKKEKTYHDLMDLIKEKLSEHVKEVRLSNRLVSAPACVVGDEQDMSPQLEELLRRSGQTSMPKAKRILELNSEHEIVKKMQERFAGSKEDPILEKYAQLLLGYAYLADGQPLPDPVGYNKVVIDLMKNAL